MNDKKIIIVAGPTASGKTDLAIDLAKILKTDVVSADSRLVYKDFNIGTAKPTKEEQRGIYHHLIDIVEPTFNYTAALYQESTKDIFQQMFNENKIPIVVGGTGFYIRSAVDGLDMPKVGPDNKLREELGEYAIQNGNEALHNKLKQIDPLCAEKIHPNNICKIIRAIEVYEKTGIPMSDQQKKKQPEFDILYICLSTYDRDILYQRINQRVFNMIESGLIEEVKFLMNKYGKTLSLLNTLGYKEVINYLENNITYNQMIEDIQKHTRQFARRQLIWFRSDERIHWYHIDKLSREEIIRDLLNKL